ncbi:MAG: pentapeptide repeat-containing protein, partial [Deltaproteobacteria bacterium]|nr:pentapeptide repeat-containing protein [Deltaproteobacteria bacterium]
ANLRGANLSGADITGCVLYGTARNDWIIDRIKCDYFFSDSYEGKRVPKDRNFKPDEFECKMRERQTQILHGVKR